MPQVLTMTQLPDESKEQFAERISQQVQEFFGQSTEAAPESTEPAPESTDETSPAATDETPAEEAVH